MKKIKKGDLVTFDSGSYSNASNTYEVIEFYKKNLDADYTHAFLAHPLVKESCYLLKPLEQLNIVLGRLKNPTEKCLEFSHKYSNYLGYRLQADLDALSLYFFIHRDFAPNQKETLSFICGKISSVLTNNDLKMAAELVNSNIALLDDFNKIWYENLRIIFKDVTKATTKPKKSAIFKIAGFVMAQIKDNT